jgi:hypothetical protein
MIETDENRACLFLFTTPLDAFEYLRFRGLDPDQWEVASSKEFGGIASLLKKASKLSTDTPTHMLIDPPMEHHPSVDVTTIEYAIDYFESSTWAEQWNSGGPKTPFWVLIKRVGNGGAGVLLLNTEPGVVSVCLFKTEMDAEEARHSWPGAYTWESDGPADPNHAVAALKELSSQGCSHALINPPPPSGTSRLPQPVPIGDVIDHIKSKGQIRDLA